MIRWQTGFADVVDVAGKTVTVLCPHCGKPHKHGRGMLGSKNVVAGCHAGPTRLREYCIPERPTPTRDKPSRKPMKRDTVKAA